MRKALVILVIVATLAAAAVGAYLSINSLVLSIYGYRSPLQNAPALTMETTSPLTAQVVVVLVDGLRYDSSLQMPYLNQLRRDGAQARMMANSPSTTQTAWVTLISGAGPELNDMPLFERSAELLQPLTIDHLFAAVRRADGTAGIAGFQWWEKLVPPDSLDLKYFVHTEDDIADGLVVDRALVFVRQFSPTLLFVNLRQVLAAGQAFGGDSPEYLQAALRCDEYIRRLAAAMDLQHSVLVVCSSHGQLAALQDDPDPQSLRSRVGRLLGTRVLMASAGYGGDEAVVLTTPLVVAGEAVWPGDYGALNQTDLAPLVATLLGVPIPSASQGTVPMHMLRMELMAEAEKILALASQRLRVANIYLYSIHQGTLTQTAEGDLLVGQSSLAVKNYESAAELGVLAIEQVERETTRARSDRIRNGRLVRAPLAAVAILVPLWILWVGRRRQGAWTILLALLCGGLYHALFLWQGGVYSFSRMPAAGLAATLEPSLRRAALCLALGGLLLALWMWRAKQRSFFAVIRLSYLFAILLLYFVGVSIVACIWWSGPRFDWYIPSLSMAYVHFAVLMQAMVTAALAIVLPLPVLIVQRLLLAISDWRDRRRMRVPSIKEV